MPMTDMGFSGETFSQPQQHFHLLPCLREVPKTRSISPFRGNATDGWSGFR